MYKRLYSMGIAAYLVMLLLSVLFFKERIIFLDTSFTLFHIIKEHFFSIQVYRFGDVYTQLWPMMGVKMHASMRAIVMCYSIAYMSYYFICYILCGSVLKRPDVALIILLLNTLFVTDTFYWITSQLPQSIALFMVAMAFVSSRGQQMDRRANRIVLLFLIITTAFFHPMAVFVLVYAAYYFTERKVVVTDKKTLFVTGVIYFLAIVIKAVAFRTPYERHSMSGMKNFIVLFPHYFATYANKQLLLHCLTIYYWIPVLFTAIVLLYITEKAWRRLFVFLGLFLGYLLLINVSFADERTTNFYIESMYLPLSIFLALPFVYELLPLLQKRKLALPVLALILASCCARIYITHNTYTARLNYERGYLNKYGHDKVLLRATHADTAALQLLWGVPYECLLLSECERGIPASIIIDEHPENMGWATHAPNLLLVNWNMYPYKTLDPEYFHFTDTVTMYTIQQ